MTEINITEHLRKLKHILIEGDYDGKTLISVDIQPEYADGIAFNLNHWAEMLNEHTGHIIFLFNGHDTLGMITLGDYQEWLFEHGVSEDVINNATFYDKGYAFFRYCIDEGIDDQQTVNLVKFMMEKDVNDSRDLNEEFWEEFTQRYGDEDIRKLVQFAHDGIYLPELMDFLGHWNNIVVCGGGANECLKEVEIALQALGKPYETYHDYVYEGQFTLNESISASEATNNFGSVQTIIDGKRNIGTVTFEDIRADQSKYAKLIKLINDNGLNTIHVRSNPHRFYIVYRPGHEEEAYELNAIAEKYGGYLAVNASKQDSIRIGQLLGYNQSDIDSYVKKNYEWNPPETVDSVFENVKRLRKLMNLAEDVQQSDKQDFRNTLSVLLQAPNSPRSIYGEEQLVQTINNAFTYSTRGTVKKTYSVNVGIYKSKNGTRYLAEDDGDILCAAFVDNDNNITGIITDMGYTNVGIGTNLTNLIKKVNPSTQFGGVASKEGQKLISRTQHKA